MKTKDMNWFKKLLYRYKLHQRRKQLIQTRVYCLKYGFPLVFGGRDKNLEEIMTIDEKLDRL